jgi:hypothetical protein
MNTSKLHFSNHAAIRKQQRGISTQAIDCILQYGDCFNAGCGCISHLITGKSIKEFSHLTSDLRLHRNIAIVEANDGSILTVMHVKERLPKHWTPARLGGYHD